MYTVLANEFADVDQGLFRKVGRFIGVKALPTTTQIFATKSIRFLESDTEEECQNSLLVTVDTDTIYKCNNCNEWMEPGILYENDNREHFAELRYEYPLGLVNLTMFFLVRLEDCEFYFKNDGKWSPITFERLQDSGDFLWAAQ